MSQIERGVCRVCGCTETSPCFNPKYGYCWWADDTHTLCSHCADKKIMEDQETKHNINGTVEVPEDAECCSCENFCENDEGEFCGLSGEPVCCCDKACVSWRGSAL